MKRPTHHDPLTTLGGPIVRQTKKLADMEKRFCRAAEKHLKDHEHQLQPDDALLWETARRNGSLWHLPPDEIMNAFTMVRDVSRAMASLTPREERIIRMLYGIGCEQTPSEEAADRFSVTRERIRQIRLRALAKLRKNQSLANLRDNFGRARKADARRRLPSFVSSRNYIKARSEQRAAESVARKQQEAERDRLLIEAAVRRSQNQPPRPTSRPRTVPPIPRCLLTPRNQS